MARIRHAQRPAQAFAGTPASVRNSDRAERVSRNLLDLARRGPAMATQVEQELTGLGSGQLKQVVAALWAAAALWAELARKETHDAD